MYKQLANANVYNYVRIAYLTVTATKPVDTMK